MSEYWVSKKRYFCKYCDVYIADDVPSRQHHENGLRHKGNVERFVRGLYKAGEKKKKDADEERREMRRIEQAASAAFAQDVGAGRAQYKASTSASSPAVASSSQKPRNPGGISDYSTPESLGYTDPDIERALAEAERRRTQGIAGDWQVVESAPAEPSSSGTGEEPMRQDDGTLVAGDDRAVPDAAEDDDDNEGRWKLRKKTITVGLGEIYDPGVIAIKPKPKAEVETVNSAMQPSVAGDPNATAVPKWAPVKWKKAGEPAEDASGVASSAPAGGDDAAHTEVAPPQVIPDLANAYEDHASSAPIVDASLKEEPLPVKLEEPAEEAASSGGSLFRKRKAPVGGNSSRRGRRF